MDWVALLIVSGGLAGAIWYMREYFVGRSEKEVDEIETSFYKNVVIGKILSIDKTNIAEEIDALKDLLDLRGYFRDTRKEIAGLKDKVFILWVIIVVLSGLILIFESWSDAANLYSNYGQLLQICDFFVFIFFIIYLISYRQELKDLNEHIKNMRDYEMNVSIQKDLVK